MREIRIHGRGGQGAQVACQILATAFFRAGHWVQAFAAYGGERRGAPVTAYLRVDNRPVLVRADIDRADDVLVLDATLLADLPPGCVRDDGVVIVASAASPCGWAPGAARTLVIDAAAIAAAAGLGPIVSTAMIGAWAGATGTLPLDVLEAAVAEQSPSRREANVAACRAGYAAGAGLAAPAGEREHA